MNEQQQQPSSLALTLDEATQVVALESRKGDGGVNMTNALAYKLARITRAALAAGLARIDTGAA
ncbi:hypothetical protein [Ferrovibrio sp.]|uniref:hypothetical protein n=1 Tax=Ferrovibrio sp. TaxID=1917215 RepID=UPI0025BDAF0E|nr:hypothetical protein [Ferrovibrio sp.]MBX3456588.1 hypothetical protein [Ferrovibrio sp.]